MVMRILTKAPDGGPNSPVSAFFLCEFKGLFSIALLRFNPGGREAFHTHAFNAWTWFLFGSLVEERLQPSQEGFPRVMSLTTYSRSLLPKVTRRENNHRVVALVPSWCFSIRGSWAETWTEDSLSKGTHTVLGHGREVKEVTHG